MRYKNPIALAAVLLFSANLAQAADPELSLSRLPQHLGSMRLGGAVPAAPAPTLPPPNLTFFDMPSSTNTEAGAFNLGAGGAASHVVGCYVPYSSTTGNFDGFEYTLTTHGANSTATFETIGPSNVNFCPYDINDSGVVVGSYQPAGTATGVYEGFVLEGTTLTTLMAPYTNTCLTIPVGVNDTGTVVGEYETNVSCTSDHGWAEGSFTWSNGVYTLISGPTGSVDNVPSGINSAGTIVGTALNSTETLDFGWILRGGVYTTLIYPGAAETIPYAINDAGEITGEYCADTFANCNANGGPYQNFLYQAGVFSTLTVPGLSNPFFYGLNNKGVLSGYYTDASGFSHGLLFTP